MSTEKIFIAGEWSESGSSLPVVNPFTGKAFAETYWADENQVEKSLSCATRAFESVQKLTSPRRGQICAEIAAKLEVKAEDFARLIVAEAGKPLTDARREVKRAVAVFRDASREALHLDPQPLPLDFPPGQENRAARLGRFPIGPVLCVTPFNFPLNLVAHKVAPALACGAPFILKPSPKTPLTSLLLARTLLEAGLAPESFSVFPAGNAAVLR